MWWWGEQEAAGAKKWLADTVALYQKKHPNVTIKTVLQTTNGLVPAFKAAAAAKKGPDIQYFWGGIWSLEDAWAGSTKPVSDYIPKSELKHYLNTSEDTYNGKVWTAGWYVQPSFPVLYRKDVLAKAGVAAAADLGAAPRRLRHAERQGDHAARGRNQRRLVRRLALLDHRRAGRQVDRRRARGGRRQAEVHEHRSTPPGGRACRSCATTSAGTTTSTRSSSTRASRSGSTARRR